MPWRDPERWFTIPIIGGMLAIFWRGISRKSEKIDESLVEYVTRQKCEDKQTIITFSLEKTIQAETTQLSKDFAKEMRLLKDETFEHMRAIEMAIREGHDK